MKILIILASLLSFNIFADSNAELNPQFRATCESQGVNSINHIVDKKVVENAQMIEISFKMFYGDCTKKQFKIRQFQSMLH